MSPSSLAPGAVPAQNTPKQVNRGHESSQPLADDAVASTASQAAVKAVTSIKHFQYFISLVFSISIFGASTFAVIAGQMEDPAELWKPDPPPFTLATVRKFLAVAWLCFILSIAVAGYSSSVLTALQQQARGRYDKTWSRRWRYVGITASVALHFLLVFAFLFMALGLVAYVGTIGWVAVGFCCLAGVFVLGLSIFQFVYETDDV
ncbi:hypothetical protein QIS74_06405 [Colletotrichum tabaci]|uniref:Transmembrane protein n=1 Tax=Colletotrichum tabaci TaxID=1209068 RepID=A0AAV9TDR4_9PEZI